MISRHKKENRLNQKAIVIWLTGLSGSGKTTLAENIEQVLFSMGYLTQLLDGDSLRNGINKNLGFLEQDREENIRRVAEISLLFINCGVICINSFISPTHKIREIAKNIIGSENFIEIFLLKIPFSKKYSNQGKFSAKNMTDKIREFLPRVNQLKTEQKLETDDAIGIALNEKIEERIKNSTNDLKSNPDNDIIKHKIDEKAC